MLSYFMAHRKSNLWYDPLGLIRTQKFEVHKNEEKEKANKWVNQILFWTKQQGKL